ncbi:VWA domain-containing protein [Marinomonas sp. IMCC 4694]|uniref:VWA domain-containing protein n=1 Tax=Marinomonas sp. IMCC 4694 TaxID=2605432 RepID=UPI0011E67CE2|nr:VWA domain-containing protein [Marinomonas sp. IMCC 4694]TYL47514.1 VWA domain-containing protein [Marinomonas sp. IMCC 4694]
MMLFDWLHFERPWWLLLIPATLVLARFVTNPASQQNALKAVIAPNLFKHLVYTNTTSHRNKWLGIVAVCYCWIGIAGISWTQAPTTMFENTQKTVLVVDQSLSMYATDIQPNRQTQLKQIIRDILDQSKEGDIALVAFAGEGFVISPFSQDRETIMHFLLALDPRIMPVYGSNLSHGIETALALNKDSLSPIHLIIFTDDLSEEDKIRVPALLKDQNIRLDLIAVGTQKGALIELPDGQVLRQDGKLVIPGTPMAELNTLTTALNGIFHQGRLSPEELEKITEVSIDNDQTKKAQNQSTQWMDQGHWFALPFLLWLAFQFRKGLMLILLVSIIWVPSDPLQASPLDWFLTPDQKGQKAVDQGDWRSAEQAFSDPKWKAASAYALEDYESTVETLNTLSNRSAAENYNMGNALALSGDTQAAISAYETALEQDPSLLEAKENLDYLKQQLEQEQEQQEKRQQEPTSDQNSEQGKSSDTDEPNPSNAEDDAKNDNKKDETQDKKKPPEDNDSPENAVNEPLGESPTTPLDQEKTQALNQWLRQIQDDPGLLLQRKLWYLHQERRNENRFSQEDGQNPW